MLRLNDSAIPYTTMDSIEWEEYLKWILQSCCWFLLRNVIDFETNCSFTAVFNRIAMHFHQKNIRNSLFSKPLYKFQFGCIFGRIWPLFAVMLHFHWHGSNLVCIWLGVCDENTSGIASCTAEKKTIQENDEIVARTKCSRPQQICRKDCSIYRCFLIH